MISGVDDVRTYLSCPCNRRYLIHTLNVFFFFSYSIEFIIMTIGLGLKEYSKGWGLFDFLMLVFMILELVDVDTTDCRDFYNYTNVGYPVIVIMESGQVGAFEWMQTLSTFSDFMKMLKSAKTIKFVKAIKTLRMFRALKSQAFARQKMLLMAIVNSLYEYLVYVIIVGLIGACMFSVAVVNLLG